MPINPRIALNHPSGSTIEINEIDSEGNFGHDNAGGNVQVVSVGNINVSATEQLNLVSSGANFFVAKDSIHTQADKLTNWAVKEMVIENAMQTPGSSEEQEMGNKIHMRGCITTLESKDRAKVHVQGGEGAEVGVDAAQITLTLDDMKITMNKSEHLSKIEIIFSETNQIVLNDAGIWIGTGITPVFINNIPQTGD